MKVESSFCESYQTAVELLGKRWNGAIVAVLRDGARRYSQLVAAIPGVSERLLSERLRELEAVGIVVRRVLPGPPIGVEYRLTQAGKELGPAIDAVASWGRKWVETGRIASPGQAEPASH